MTTKTPPSESAALCATALAICHSWFEATKPDAMMRAEITPGSWHLIGMMDACEKALEAFRDEHGETDS